MKNDAFESSFYERFSEEEREPPITHWIEINRKLEADRRKRRRGILLWWVFGIVGVFGAAIFLWYWQTLSTEKSKPPVANALFFYNFTKLGNSGKNSTESEGLNEYKANKFREHQDSRTLRKRETTDFVSKRASTAPISGQDVFLEKESILAFGQQPGDPIVIDTAINEHSFDLAFSQQDAWQMSPLLPDTLWLLTLPADIVLEPHPVIPINKPVNYSQSPALWGSIAPIWQYFSLQSNQHDEFLIDEIVSLPRLSLQRLGLQVQAGVNLPLSANTSLRLSTTYRYQPLHLVLKTRQWVKDSVHFTPLSLNVVQVEPNLQEKQWQLDEKLHKLGLSIAIEQKILRSAHWLLGVQTGASVFQWIGKNSFAQARHQVFVDASLVLQRKLSDKCAIQIMPQASIPFRQQGRLTDAPFFVKTYQWGLGVGLDYRLFSK